MNINYEKAEMMDSKQFSFGALLITAIKLDTQLDKALKEFDLTSKQWFLMVILDTMFESAPTLNELAKEMGSSYQNVKQVALKLKEKNMIDISKDPKDARALRIKSTPESKLIWDKLIPTSIKFMDSFFKNIEEKDLDTLKKVLFQLMFNLNDMETS